MRTAFVFPGQGAEEPAMGLELARAEPDAAALLALVSEVVGFDVLRALERGGRALEATEALQPLLTAVGLASARALARRGVQPAVVAGHSLGELTAACFATELDPRAAIELASVRGRAMAEAARRAPGGMVAVRGAVDEVLRAMDEVEGASLAAVNAPDEVVVSGPHGAMNEVLRRFGARATKLRAAGPWHSEAMRGAVDTFRAEVARRMGGAPSTTPLVASPPALGLVEALAEGLVGPVRFTEVLARLEADGVTRVVVAAPSRVVRSLIRRNLRGRVEVFGADTPARHAW